MADPPQPVGAPVLLTEAYDSSTFDSGEAILDNWLRQRAWSNLRAAASRTYVVCPTGSQRVVAFFSMNMGQILVQDVTGAMRRNMPLAIPAVILGRFAIDRAFQGQGMGSALLAEVVERAMRASQQVSARLIIVHAISPAAEAFYLHHGFTRLPVDTPTLALDLVKLEKLRPGAQ